MLWSTVFFLRVLRFVSTQRGDIGLRVLRVYIFCSQCFPRAFLKEFRNCYALFVCLCHRPLDLQSLSDRRPSVPKQLASSVPVRKRLLGIHSCYSSPCFSVALFLPFFFSCKLILLQNEREKKKKKKKKKRRRRRRTTTTRTRMTARLLKQDPTHKWLSKTLLGQNTKWSNLLFLFIHRFYIALFSALKQTHCAHVACDSE